MAPTVVIVTTLDTKSVEAQYVRELIAARGIRTIVVDVGVLGEEPRSADISHHEVAEAGGTTIARLIASGDRSDALKAMTDGAVALIQAAHSRGEVEAIIGFGGSGNTTIATAAMRALPFGIPKIMVSTVASSDVRQYVGVSDIAMLYPIVDVAGLNRITRTVLANAAHMVIGAVTLTEPEVSSDRPLIAATMFGVTTPCVDVARETLEHLGYEVLVFHATGTGGQAMESLIRSGAVVGVLDVTTTELADEFAGGLFSAGPHRLEAAASAGVPQVVSLGALDMANFLGPETVPECFAGRLLHAHTPHVTLMRTSVAENRAIGIDIATKLNRATGPVAVYVPLRGVSSASFAGQPLHDAAADAALFDALRSTLTSQVELHEFDTDINDPAFARAMAEHLHHLITSNEES